MAERIEGTLAELRAAVALIDAEEYPKTGVPRGKGPHANPLRVTYTWGTPEEDPERRDVYTLGMKPVAFRHLDGKRVAGRRLTRADVVNTRVATRIRRRG